MENISHIDFDMGPEPGVIDLPNPLDVKNDGDGLGADPRGDAVADPPGEDPAIMSKEDFFQMFCGLIEAPNMVLTFKGEDPLQSLVIAPGDPQARAASDVLYKTCLRVRWLRWMLAPEAEWAKDLMIVGAFSFARFRLVREELNIRATSKAEDPPPSKNDNSDKSDKRPKAGEPNDDAPPMDTGQDEVLKVGMPAND